ncbi:MAG: hypothetical protein ACI4TF_01685 [Oliverpabstia sp.]
MGVQNFEQQIRLYHSIFVYCAIASLIVLIITIILFFVLKIPKVIGEITGRDARKAISEMMEDNKISVINRTNMQKWDGDDVFVIERSIVEIHTDEVIGEE